MEQHGTAQKTPKALLKEFDNAEHSLKESDKNLELGKWSISFSSFLVCSEWLGKRSTILPSLRNLKRAMGLGFLQATKLYIKTQYPCNDTKTAWEVFHGTTTFHGIIFPFSSFVFVLEKGYSSVLEK